MRMEELLFQGQMSAAMWGKLISHSSVAGKTIYTSSILNNEQELNKDLKTQSEV